MKVPKGWRQGQFIVNFLCWLNDQEGAWQRPRLDLDSTTMAEPFYMEDNKWDELMEEYLKQQIA